MSQADRPNITRRGILTGASVAVAAVAIPAVAHAGETVEQRFARQYADLVATIREMAGPDADGWLIAAGQNVTGQGDDAFLKLAACHGREQKRLMVLTAN